MSFEKIWRLISKKNALLHLSSTIIFQPKPLKSTGIAKRTTIIIHLLHPLILFLPLWCRRGTTKPQNKNIFGWFTLLQLKKLIRLAKYRHRFMLNVVLTHKSMKFQNKSKAEDKNTTFVRFQSQKVQLIDHRSIK